MDLGRKWLVDFNAGKIQLNLFEWSNSSGAIDKKMNGFYMKEKPSFKMQGMCFSSDFDWCSYIVSIVKTASKKIGALICLLKVFLFRLLFISVNLPYSLA